MDKETLSNYGWIVICVLILAVMIALATPFGSFIADGFKATYAGFAMTGENALGVIIPGSNGEEGPGNVNGGTKDTYTINVPGLGEVEVNDPDIELRYDPNTGEVSGLLPPKETDTPPELPADTVPSLIEFEYGNFNSKANYTPGTYEDVTYETTHSALKLPAGYSRWVWSKWQLTLRDGEVINTQSSEIDIADIDTKYSTYILYDYNVEENAKLEMNGIKGDSVRLWTITNSSKDTKDDIVYLAAFLNKAEGVNSNRHVAKWDGTKYIEVNYDTEIAAVDSFSYTYTTTHTERVMVTKPSTTLDYVYVPAGTLKAEEGMTWREWIPSEYNTTGKTQIKVKDSDYKDISLDSKIEAGKQYGFVLDYTPIVVASREYPNDAHFGELIESKISCYGVDKWEVRISPDTLLICKEIEDFGDSLSIFNCGDFDVYFGGDSDVSEYQGQTFIVDASYGDLMVTFGSYAGGKFYMEIFPMDADGNYIPWDADDVTINRW